jgi:hypothetical protein
MRRLARRRSASLEDLLDADVSDGSALSRVLSAARAPGTSEEMAGLGTAMSAFYVTGPASPRPPMPTRSVTTRTVTGRWIALKALAALSGASLIGGAAYAATNAGFLDNLSPHKPGQQTTHTVPGTSSSNGDRSTGRTTTDPTGGRNHPGESTARTAPHPGRVDASTPSPGSNGGPPGSVASPSHTPARPTPTGTNPTHPAHPSHPVHPTQAAATPTQPAKPTRTVAPPT